MSGVASESQTVELRVIVNRIGGGIGIEIEIEITILGRASMQREGILFEVQMVMCSTESVILHGRIVKDCRGDIINDFRSRNLARLLEDGFPEHANSDGGLGELRIVSARTGRITCNRPDGMFDVAGSRKVENDRLSCRSVSFVKNLYLFPVYIES